MKNISNVQHCRRLCLFCFKNIAERFCCIQTTSKRCGKTMSIYWHQIPFMTTDNAVLELVVAVVSIYVYHLRHLYVFCTTQCYWPYVCICQKTVSPVVKSRFHLYKRHDNPSSAVRTRLMFTDNVYCDVTNSAPFQVWHFVGADKHHLFWNILIKVVPGLIWMQADMTLNQPGDFLYNLFMKNYNENIKRDFY